MSNLQKNLPLEEFTVAEALKAGGYTTATMGKWHVCWDRDFYPAHQGFDLNVGGNNMGNPGNYFFPYNGKWRMTRKHPYTHWNTLPNGKPGEYLTDRLTVEAEQFIEQNKKRPFFLYLSYYSVHTPLQAPKERVAKYEKTERRAAQKCYIRGDGGKRGSLCGKGHGAIRETGVSEEYGGDFYIG